MTAPLTGPGPSAAAMHKAEHDRARLLAGNLFTIPLPPEQMWDGEWHSITAQWKGSAAKFWVGGVKYFDRDEWKARADSWRFWFFVLASAYAVGAVVFAFAAWRGR